MALSVFVVLRPASSTVVKKIIIYTATSGALELVSFPQTSHAVNGRALFCFYSNCFKGMCNEYLKYFQKFIR